MSQPSIIFTCSTWLGLPDKMAQFSEAMSSLLARHSVDEIGRISKFLIVNEFDANRTDDFESRVRSQFGSHAQQVEFVQKGSSAAGQAKTLNLILERIKPFDYWIHWEESWCCTRAFISDALDVMQRSEVTQLQFTSDWRDATPSRLIVETSSAGARYLKVRPHWKLQALNDKFSPMLDAAFSYADFWHAANAEGWTIMWPLYSLRPSMNRVAFHDGLAPFDEAPHLWPVRFEWEYAQRWLRAGAIKAVLDVPAAQRQPNHVSTYTRSACADVPLPPCPRPRDP